MPIPSSEHLDTIAERFRILGEPMRLRILAALKAGGELPVSALVEATGGQQANISRHLAALRQAGVVARRREGTWIYYRVCDPLVFRLCETVCGGDQKLAEVRAAFTGAG